MNKEERMEMQHEIAASKEILKENPNKTKEDAEALDREKGPATEKIKVPEKLLENTRAHIDDLMENNDRYAPEEIQQHQQVFKTSSKPEQTAHKSSMLKKFILATGLTIGALFAPKEAKGAENTKDSLLNKTSVKSKKDPSDSLDKKNIAIYSSSKTKEGAITPTGFNNAFHNNEYGIKEDDLENIAKQFGFRTTSTLDFQSDLLDYLQKNHPEIIEHSLEKFGETAYAKETGKHGIDGLKDGKLGARTAFLMSELKKTDTKPNPAETIETGIKQPTGKYVINVRGDESNEAGRYFFFDSKEEFDKVTDKLANFSTRTYDKDGAQASVDMHYDVFQKYHVEPKGMTEELGKAWIRDVNTGKFVQRD
jgi:hypothetical protein